MPTESEVLTGHNEVICSTSIERIVTGRDAALTQIEALLHQLDNISRLTAEIGGDVANHWAMYQGRAFDCWLMQPVDKAMKGITRNIDRSIWRSLMVKSGMLSGKDRPLLAHPPLRTERATFTALRSSLSKPAFASRFHYFKTSSMDLTVADRMNHNEISIFIRSPVNPADDVMNVPLCFQSDQLMA